ncbi:hypothetical protein DPMN_184642 [Dreissena polymorpha]|uniref:Uncharacterized protein n=1 Tax=Dreissena polymorpha TaxID=45954 RepID=A0A9D4DKR6_DREPO|nr:hypothetical protein DPMN_184642 [Dreissena polymorpha]
MGTSLLKQPNWLSETRRNEINLRRCITNGASRKAHDTDANWAKINILTNCHQDLVIPVASRGPRYLPDSILTKFYQYFGTDGRTGFRKTSILYSSAYDEG